jgi:hypothetical protein
VSYTDGPEYWTDYVIETLAEVNHLKRGIDIVEITEKGDPLDYFRSFGAN